MEARPAYHTALDNVGGQAHSGQAVLSSTWMPSRGLATHFRRPLGIASVWLAAAPFALAVASLLTPIRPFDYFWSLVQGRAIVQLGRIPTQNLFLYTIPADAAFFDQPWLAQLAMFAAYRVGGHTANLFLLAVLLAMSMAFALDTGLRQGGNPRGLSVLALAVAPLLVLGAGVRTQMFAYPCFVLVLREALRRRERGGLRTLWPAAVCTVLWSNLHGSFVLAPVMFGLASAGVLLADGSAQRRWLARFGWWVRDLGVIVLATLVNPRGPMIYRYVLDNGLAVRHAGGTGVEEWLPLSPGTPLGIWFCFLAGLLTIIGVARAVAHGLRYTPFALLPNLGFAALTLVSQRFLPWWALSAVVALAPIRAGGEMREPAKGSSWPNLTLLAIFALIALACVPGAPLFERAALRAHLPYAGARALGVESPLRLAEELAKGYPGNLFHSQAVGGLVEWILASRAPRPVAFVDQRFEIQPANLWRDYFTICAAGPGWRSLINRHGIGTILVDEESAKGLLVELARDPDWRLVERELAYRLYKRADPR